MPLGEAHMFYRREDNPIWCPQQMENIYPLVQYVFTEWVFNTALPHNFILPGEFTANWTSKQIAAERIKISSEHKIIQ